EGGPDGPLHRLRQDRLRERGHIGRPDMSAPPPRNRRQEIQLTPEEQAAFLRQHHKAAFATIDKDGFPHVVGMNYVVKDGAFYMTSYGKAQKVLNVRRNPKVGLMVETGDSCAEATEDGGRRQLSHGSKMLNGRVGQRCAR